MTPSLRSLLRASRFMAMLGLLSLSFTEDIVGLWIQGSWLMLAFSFFFDRYPQWERPMRRWETLGVITLVTLTILDFWVLKNTLFVVVAHFLLLLQILKLVGLKERKDCVQIGLIGFFQLMAACTLSAEIWQALLLALLIPGATALLYWSHAAKVEEEARARTPWPYQSLKRLHFGINLSALPLNVAMTVMVFLLFPRLTFNVRIPGFGAGQSAYTDQMNLEQTGAVTRDRSPAAWMGFANDAQRAEWSGYLRGDILNTFDGKQWANARQEQRHVFQPDGNNIFKLSSVPPRAHVLHAMLTLLNTTKSTLFTPGTPIEITVALPRLESSNAGDLHWTTALQHPLQYQLLFIAGERLDGQADEHPLSNVYSELPTHGLERVQHLSDRIASHGSSLTKAQALEQYLRNHYQYTLNFGKTVPENPVDFFLFESHQGFCIHFASALAVMLRLEHIPSRVVAGYYHGEWNPLAQKILFREQDAHAWVEAWVDGRWITLDPSPRATAENLTAAPGRKVWLRLQETWDYLSYQWNQLIIQYDLYSQLHALERLRSHSDNVSARWMTGWTHWRQRLRHTEPSLGAASDTATTQDASATHHGVWPLIIFLGCIIAGTLFFRFTRSNPHGVPNFYIRFLKQMSRKGIAKHPAETAEEFAERAAQKLPDQASHIEQTTSAYYRLRFGKK